MLFSLIESLIFMQFLILKLVILLPISLLPYLFIINALLQIIQNHLLFLLRFLHLFSQLLLGLSMHLIFHLFALFLHIFLSFFSCCFKIFILHIHSALSFIWVVSFHFLQLNYSLLVLDTSIDDVPFPLFLLLFLSHFHLLLQIYLIFQLFLVLSFYYISQLTLLMLSLEITVPLFISNNHPGWNFGIHTINIIKYVAAL